jgi:trans-aconitate 2-methyltransferase
MAKGSDSARGTGSPAGTRWDPAQYSRFSDHRLRPALELLARIPLESPRVVVDLGCGTGNVTRLLAERWPNAAVHGIDHSKEMLREARSVPGDIQWIEADIAQWIPQDPPDVIYSNAALHWASGHYELFPRLAGFLAAGGCLAVQMPLSWDAPSHRLMRETLAGGGPGGGPLGPETLRQTTARRPVESTGVYYDLLTGPGRAVDIWETEYLQILNGEDPILEWIKGTGLRPVLNALPPRELGTFLAAYRRRLRDAYPPRPDGTTLYPFRRLFVVVAR